MKPIRFLALFAFFLTVGGLVFAQSEDALLNKLVEKGILTQKEAADLRREADKDFTTAYSAKSGMPAWVTSLKFSGDLRLRYDSAYFEAPSIADWYRFRYRLRFGMVAVLKDDFEVGFRLASGTGNPTSVNQTFQNNASKKEIRVDLAYAKWFAVNNPNWGLSLTGGKMENPFGTQELLFDIDYTPEGAAQQLFWNINPKHTVRFTGGEFVINELPKSGNDPFVLAGQIRLDSAWSTNWQTSLGAMGLGLVHGTDISRADLGGSYWDYAAGNTHTGIGPNSRLAHNMTPWQFEGAVTYFVVKPLAFYPGRLPVRVAGQIIHNPSAPDSNTGWLAGGSIGKAGKRGTWELNYKFRWLEGDAWWDSIVDDDTFAAYGVTSIYGTEGVHSGTNLRSHIVSLQYCPRDFLLIGVRYYHNALIQTVPNGYPSADNRFLVDMVWKF